MPPQPSPPSLCLSALYLPAKLEKGFPLPLPRDTHLNGLELQVHEVSEKWGLSGGALRPPGRAASGLVELGGALDSYSDPKPSVYRRKYFCFEFWSTEGKYSDCVES